MEVRFELDLLLGLELVTQERLDVPIETKDGIFDNAGTST